MKNQKKSQVHSSIYVSYSKTTVISLVAFMIFILIISLNNKLYSFGFLLFALFYINLAFGIKTLRFEEDKLIVKYPFRAFNRVKSLSYDTVIKLFRGNGSYVDGSVLVLLFKKGSGEKKMVFNFPGNEKWEEVVKFVSSKSKSIKFAK